MKIIVDINGKVGFDEWFDQSDLPALLEGLNNVGFKLTYEEVDYEFKPVPVLKKKDRFGPIPMTAKNIFLMLSNADKDNEQILKILNIERESNFVITTLIRKLQGEYLKWEKIDHLTKWKDDKERMMAFARYFEAKKKNTDKQIEHIIYAMNDAGCKQLDTDRFPECKDEFNKECMTCQFGKKHITSQEDIDRFNNALNNIIDEE